MLYFTTSVLIIPTKCCPSGRKFEAKYFNNFILREKKHSCIVLLLNKGMNNSTAKSLPTVFHFGLLNCIRGNSAAKSDMT